MKKERTKKKSSWKFARPVRFDHLYWFLFITLFSFSWGASYLWSTYMDDCCRSTRGNDDYSFFGWLLVLCVLYWSTVEFMYYKNVFIHVSKILSLFFSAQITFLEKLRRSQQQPIRIISDAKEGKETTEMSLENCADEGVFMLSLSMYMFIWQVAGKKQHIDYEEARSIAELMLNPRKNNVFKTPQMMQQVSESMKREEESSDDVDTPPCIILLDTMRERLDMMSDPDIGMLEGIELLDKTLLDIRTHIHSLEELLHSGPPTILKYTIQIIGVVSAFLAPPIFYSLMGNKILYMGPLFFLCIGSFALFNMCRGDILRFHTTKYMGEIFRTCWENSIKIQKKYNDRFITSGQPKPVSYTTTYTSDGNVVTLVDMENTQFIKNVGLAFIPLQ